MSKDGGKFAIGVRDKYGCREMVFFSEDPPTSEGESVRYRDREGEPATRPAKQVICFDLSQAKQAAFAA